MAAGANPLVLSMDKNIYKADALLVLAAVIWGCAFVAQRMGMEHVGPFTFNGVRFALGALVLVPFSIKKSRRPGAASRKTVLLGGLLAGCVLFTGASLQQIGLVYTTAGKAGFITGLYVIIVPILGLLWRQYPLAGEWMGAVLACVGLYLLSVTEGLSFAPGDLWVVMGAVAWSVHVLIIGWLSPKMNPVRLACIQFAVCSVFSCAVSLAFEHTTLEALWAAALPIAYGGFMSVGVAYTLQVVAQSTAPPTHAAIILSMEAPFAALAGWVILSEVLTLRPLVGCGLMLAGMMLAQLWPMIVRKNKAANSPS